MLLDVTHLLTPFFAVLTALVVLAAGAIVVSAVRRHRKAARPAPRVRVAVRPAAVEQARQARSA